MARTAEIGTKELILTSGKDAGTHANLDVKAARQSPI
jgi:hypothetical protein